MAEEKVWICKKRAFKDTWINQLVSESNMQISDGTVPGLYLRYSKKTKNISFFLGCFIKSIGKRKNLFLGKWQDFEDVEQLIKKAREWRKIVISGNAPVALTEKEKTTEQLIEESNKKRFNDLFPIYMDKYAKLYKKPSTQKTNEQQFKLYLYPQFGKKYVEDLAEKDILDAYAAWVKQTSFSTANKALSLMSSFWDWCESYGYMPRRSNPCGYVKKGTNAKYKATVLDIDGYKKLFKSLEDGPAKSKMHPRLFRAIKVLALTGCRASEITDLEMDELSLNEKIIHLKDSKTGARDVKLGEAAVKELQIAAQEAELLNSKYVFPGIYNKDQPITNITKPFEWALADAGLPHMRIHDLRHSFITMGANLGENMNAMKDAAGHARLTTTEMYTHYAAEQTFKAVNHITEAICE